MARWPMSSSPISGRLALDAGPVLRAGRPVHRIPYRAESGAGLPGDLGAATGPGCWWPPQWRIATSARLRRLARSPTPRWPRRPSAADSWALGWALHVLTVVAMMQGRMADALPLLDRALTVTQADPALTDLRVLLQINQAMTLGDLDRLRRRFHRGPASRAAGQPGRHHGPPHPGAELPGPVVLRHRPVGRRPRRGGPGPGTAKDPGAACCDRGVAAVICFHRGETGTARDHLAAAAPHAKRIGSRVVSTLALARSLDASKQATCPRRSTC